MWVKLDDGFNQHPKILAVGPLAQLLYLRGLVYCGQYLTDGVIPRAAVDTLIDWTHSGVVMWSNGNTGGPAEKPNNHKLAETLYNHGLWHTAEGNSGYLVHDYLRYNPSRAQVLAGIKRRSASGVSAARSRWGRYAWNDAWNDAWNHAWNGEQCVEHHTAVTGAPSGAMLAVEPRDADVEPIRGRCGVESSRCGAEGGQCGAGAEPAPGLPPPHTPPIYSNSTNSNSNSTNSPGGDTDPPQTPRGALAAVAAPPGGRDFRGDETSSKGGVAKLGGAGVGAGAEASGDGVAGAGERHGTAPGTAPLFTEPAPLVEAFAPELEQGVAASPEPTPSRRRRRTPKAPGPDAVRENAVAVAVSEHARGVFRARYGDELVLGFPDVRDLRRTAKALHAGESDEHRDAVTERLCAAYGMFADRCADGVYNFGDRRVLPVIPEFVRRINTLLHDMPRVAPIRAPPAPDEARCQMIRVMVADNRLPWTREGLAKCPGVGAHEIEPALTFWGVDYVDVGREESRRGGA